MSIDTTRPVRERPILFSAPMVRAILDGWKTQTRRVLKVQPAGAWAAPGRTSCPYGLIGDRLWVRETFCMDDNGHEEWPVYKADGVALPVRPSGCGISRWRPSIHMPRWASRITLEVTGVRVERLNHISESDARAEGSEAIGFTFRDDAAGKPHLIESLGGPYRDGFRILWESINGPDSWTANPWVWVIEFKRVA